MEVTYLKMDTTSYVDVTRSADPDDRWDRDDTSTTWEIERVRIVKTDGYQTVGFPGTLAKGDIVHSVYAIWSTGDSFGHDYGYCFEYIDAFTDLDLAEACVKSLAQENGGESRIDRWTVEYERQDGTKVKYGRSWLGYFESLVDLSIDSTCLS